MTAELSRRLAAVMGSDEIQGLLDKIGIEFYRIVESADVFEDLPKDIKDAVQSAEIKS